MSTTPPPADTTFRRRWTAFWFAPSDPTTLGFMRVMTGLLILYIHLAYSLDLQAFFGKYGWYGLAYIDRERHEFPWAVPSLTDWDDRNAVMPRLPEFPHRRQGVMRIVRALPPRQADRAEALRFLDLTTREANANTLVGLTFLLAFHETGKGQEDRVYAALAEGRQLFALADGGQIEYRSVEDPLRRTTRLIPDYLLAYDPGRRQDAAAALKALMPVLPKDGADAKYLINHLMELDQPHRQALVRFLIELPDDAGKRAELVDYLEYWNNDPRRLHHQGQRLVSVWFHVTDPAAMAAVHGVVLVLIALFTAGVCTRVTGVLTWLAVIGYIHRTNQILFGMDTMMNVLLVYLVVGDSGRALSVDRLVARYRATRASLARSGKIDAATRAFLDRPPPSPGANLGVRLIQVHFCFIYMAAGLSKLQGGAWWTGSAFWDVMVNPEFTLMRYEWFENFVRRLASWKPAYHTITALGVWFTWGLEISFPFLVWTRLRPLFVWMGVLLHAGIGVLMGLNIFELLMMVMLLVFLPPGVIRDRLRGGPGLPRLRFGYDPAKPAHASAAALVLAADVDGQVTPEPTPGVARPTLTPADGTAQTGTAAAGVLFAELRLLRYVRYALWVPGVAGLVARRVSPAA
jgi:hypothetical protein